MFQFIKRHRKNLGLVGMTITAVSGGLYLAQKYMEKRSLEAEILQTRTLINKTRCRHQFESVLRYAYNILLCYIIYIYINLDAHSTSLFITFYLLGLLVTH